MDPFRPRHAVFLDRDGTIIEDVGYCRDAKDVRLMPGSAEGLRLLQEAGFKLIVVSNQSGIARGIITMEQLQEVYERFIEILKLEGITLTDYLYCPHHPEGKLAEYRKDCSNRKGSPGMILTGAYRHGIFLPESWMVGDKADDVRTGLSGGVRTIRIGQDEKSGVKPEFYADNLLTAAKIIVERRFRDGGLGE